MGLSGHFGLQGFRALGLGFAWVRPPHPGGPPAAESKELRGHLKPDDLVQKRPYTEDTKMRIKNHRPISMRIEITLVLLPRNEKGARFGLKGSYL